jgi:UDP-4-amino-4,6-dideoxy-N-acetyl-beta-L-altrosamine transaminase
MKIPYGKQHITQEDLDAVVKVLQSDFLTQGPSIEIFEKDFATYIGAKYALALANGTAALHLCAMVLDVNTETNVITTPITFAASANCVRYCGGNVYFADIDPTTCTLDINKVGALIKSKPKGFFKGIIPVDFAGHPVNLEAYRKLANEHGLWLIEDACHAPGGYFMDSAGHKQYCGNGKYADLSIFSFHPVKHIATGEGGMITTNDEKLYQKLLLLRTHGITKKPDLMHENHGGWYYEMLELGYNYRLTDFQAALGVSQLKRADIGLAKRKEIAKKYEVAFSSCNNVKIYPYNEGHAYHLYIIQVSDRLGLYNHLKANNIFAQVHYIPVHTMPYYKQFGWKSGDFPDAEKYYSQCLSLPMYPTLTETEQSFVIEKVLEFINKTS